MRDRAFTFGILIKRELIFNGQFVDDLHGCVDAASVFFSARLHTAVWSSLSCRDGPQMGGGG